MNGQIFDKYLSYLRDERLMTDRSIKDYITAINLVSRETSLLAAKEHYEINNAIKKIKISRGWSSSTTFKIATCIKSFFAWMAREKIIPFNPYPFHEFKRGRPKTPEYITEKEYNNILSDPLLTIQEECLIRILWECAPRISELCSLDQSEINLEEMYIHIPRNKSKGGYSDRVIPFTCETLAVLKKQINIMRLNGQDDAVFVNKWWVRITPRDASEWLSKIGVRRTRCREALRLTPHMFRHSFAVRMIPKIGEVLTSKFLGHSGLSMTCIYTHLDKESSIEIYRKSMQNSA